MTRMFVVLCALTLAGCGAAKVDPRAYAHAEYQSADDEYRACINDNLKNVEKCEGKRVQMEANERAYTNMVSGITQGGTIAPRNTVGVAQGASARATPLSTSTPTPAPPSPTPQTASPLPARTPPPQAKNAVTADGEPLDSRPTVAPSPSQTEDIRER